MSRSYPPEFRRRVLDLLAAGRSVTAVAEGHQRRLHLQLAEAGPHRPGRDRRSEHAPSRRVVGWSIDSAPTAALVTNALGMAIQNRDPDGTLIHSDHGTQFTSDLGREPAWWPAHVALTGMPLTRDQLEATTAGRKVLGAWDSGDDAGLIEISDRLRPQETPAHEAGRRRAASPEAKRKVVNRLLSAWEVRPDQRLGQLIVNGYRAAYPNDIMGQGLFSVEDYGLVEIIERSSAADGSG